MEKELIEMREIIFEYGFQSANGIVKKQYHLHEIPNIANLCDVWNELPIAYVRQYSGMSDKNGKRIFEGDVLNIGTPDFGFVENGRKENVNYEVRIDGCDYILFRPDLNLKWGRLSRVDELVWNCEVVSSIHDNPELLTPSQG